MDVETVLAIQRSCSCVGMRIVSMNNITLQWIDSLVNVYGQSEELAVVEIGLGAGVLIGSFVLSVAVLCSLSVFRSKGFKSGRNWKVCTVFGSSAQHDEVMDEKCDKREVFEDSKNGEGGKNNQSVAGTEGAYRSDSESEDEEESEKLSAVAQKRARKAGVL